MPNDLSKADIPAAPRRGAGSIKNFALLGAVALGGYFLFKKIGGIDFGGGGSKKQPGQARAPVPAPDLNGPRVVKGLVAATHSQICVQQADPRFQYALINSIDANGYQNFTAPVRGHFTRRLLCVGGRKWAEIAP